MTDNTTPRIVLPTDPTDKEVRQIRDWVTRERMKREANKKPSKRKSRSKAAVNDYTEAYERFWEAYPKGRRTDKSGAWEAYQAALQNIAQSKFKFNLMEAEEYLVQRAKDYAQSERGRGQYVRQPATWLRQQGWDDDPEAWKEKDDHGRKPLAPGPGQAFHEHGERPVKVGEL